MAIFTVVMACVGAFVVSLVINALAPTFGAQKDSGQALKTGGVFVHAGLGRRMFQIVPGLGWLLGLIGGLYAPLRAVPWPSPS